ncbi:MAG: cysteine desulfurase [Ruminococcus sp.]|jgi:cysteine desulfurase|nr:cysteine desulfurase [Ruminococcus sp.]
MIYLDHAATTAPEHEVIEAVSECMKTLTANPSAAYSASAPCRAKMIEVKKQIAEFIGAAPQEIFFTSGGTESNSQAIFGASGKHIVIGAAEHSSIFAAAANFKCEISIAHADSNGIITPEAVIAAIRPETALVSIQYVNNETGIISPINEIAEVLKSRKIPFHTDAVAAFGHMPINMTNITMASVSAHKFYGPRGIGFIYIKQGFPAKPLIAGEQENHRRGGTENLPGICGMGAAIKALPKDFSTELERLQRLRDDFMRILRSKCPKIMETVTEKNVYPGIISLRLPGLPSEKAITLLDMRGIYVSGGAACSASSHSPSHVLISMGMNVNEAFEVIRISMGLHTTADEMKITADIISDIYINNPF